MFCPECGAEYREGISECKECGVALVRELPPRDDRDPVTVFGANNFSVLAVAKSLLEDAGIPYAVLNEGVQELIAAGRMGGFNPVVGPVTIQVEAARAEEAAELLAGLDEDAARESVSDDEEDEEAGGDGEETP